MLAELKKHTIAGVIPLARLYLRYAPARFAKLWLWRLFGWREHHAICKTAFGSRMVVRTNDLLQGRVYYFGTWEPNLTKFLLGRMTRASKRTFVDIGANVGYFTLLAAGVAPAAKVVAIEPFPTIFCRLSLNIELNHCSNVRAVNCAVSNARGSVTLYKGSEFNEGITTSNPNWQTAGLSNETAVSPTYPLGDILTTSEIHSARLIKIDVEGAEHAVLSGLFPLLEAMQPDIEIVVELTPHLNEPDRFQAIFDNFSDRGFQPYELPNPYDLADYLDIPANREQPRLQRLASLPTRQTDVVFSRIDAAELQ